MPSIVISYRRADSRAMSGRIFDQLAARYGADSVFMDMDNIPPGIDFHGHVSRVIKNSDMIIAIVGPQWAGFSKTRRARIHDETDPVRLEIESGLRNGVPIIPVLIEGARMPKPGDLPESIKAFSSLNAATIGAERDFRRAMDRVIRSVEQAAKKSDVSARPSAAPPAAMMGVAVAMPLGFGSFDLPDSPESPVGRYRHLIGLVLGIGAVLVVGSYLASRSIETTIAVATAIACLLFIGWMFAFTYSAEKPPYLKVGLYAAAFLLCYEVWLLLAQFHLL